MKAEGQKLKELIEAKGFGIADVMKKAKINRSTLYYRYNKQKLKRNEVEHLLNALKIPVESFYSSIEETQTTSSEPLQPTYSISTHQGRNLETYLDSKGVSVTHFAKQLNVSRPTIYSYFKEKELPLPVLLESAYVLNIPVATLKGRGEGVKSFEKDIYLELKSINERLADMQSTLQVAKFR